MKICYLCGKELKDDDEKNVDHVPPRQFYPESVRGQCLNLLTLPTHYSCNYSYQKDEDYFSMSIGTLVSETSFSGKELWRDISRRTKDPEKVGLAVKVSKEFQEKHGGLYLPSNKVVKKFDSDRMWRVVWKITRGLYFYEKGKVLPENIFSKSFHMQLEAGKEPPPEFSIVAHAPSRGKYPGVFDYKYVIEESLNNFNAWAFLLWDALILMVCFHDPECPCENCKKAKL